MLESPGFWFASSLFDIEPGEDLETNPGMYGRQLSNWLRDQLEGAGYEDCDSFGEDWGWCVTCRLGDTPLLVGCGVFADASVYDESKPHPDADDLLWYVFPTENLSWRGRRKGVPDGETGLARLHDDLERILDNELDIDLVDEPKDGDWSVPPASEAFLEATAYEPPRPMPWWLSIILGVLTLLALPVMVIAVGEVFYRPPSGREILVTSLSAILIIPVAVMCVVGIRLLLPYLRRFDDMLKASTIRLVAILVLAIPLISVYFGFAAQYPTRFAVQVTVHVLLAVLLWRMASRRTRQADATANINQKPE